MVAPGSARATWLMTRCRASGVRSSWEALAMNWRWALKATSSRASSPSKVSPSSLNSSWGAAEGEALAQAGGDAACGRGNGTQRPQHAPGDEPAERDRERRRDGERDLGPGEEFV